MLAGPGNNGGDGLVAARRLLSWGADVTVYLTRDRTGDPNLDSVVARGAPVVSAADGDFSRKLSDGLDSAQVVVDALLGTGRSRPISGVVRTVLRALSRARAQRPSLLLVAVDLPTGLDADTGRADPECIGADVTVALGYPKAGHYTGSGAGLLRQSRGRRHRGAAGSRRRRQAGADDLRLGASAAAVPSCRRAQGDLRARADRGRVEELRRGGAARGCVSSEGGGRGW